MDKGHKRNYLHRIGVKLIEFHGFGESLFMRGIIKKRIKDIKDIGLKCIFHCDTKLRRIQNRREGDPPKEGPICHYSGSGDLGPRLADPAHIQFMAYFYVSSFTVLGFAYPPLIKVGLIRGL